MTSRRTGRTTTQRGYGSAHQKRRAELLPLFLGTPCPGCGRVMLDARSMDLDHSVPLALGGSQGDRFLCRSCNRSRGATLGNKLRGARRRAARLAPRVTDVTW